MKDFCDRCFEHVDVLHDLALYGQFCDDCFAKDPTLRGQAS